MNASIKELARQVPNWTCNGVFVGPYEKSLEKFAELVAQKCAEAIREDLKKFADVDLVWTGGMEQSAHVVERTFGLKK